jgi:hypothetical protein
MYGCGYTDKNKLWFTVGWKCPNCKLKNTSQFSEKHHCEHCDYILNQNDEDNIKYE